jgi:hypothetical protein
MEEMCKAKHKKRLISPVFKYSLDFEVKQEN